MEFVGEVDGIMAERVEEIRDVAVGVSEMPFNVVYLHGAEGLKESERESLKRNVAITAHASATQINTGTGSVAV